MFCSKCGLELKNGEAYCPRCGNKVGDSGNASWNFQKFKQGFFSILVRCKNGFIANLKYSWKQFTLILANIIFLWLSSYLMFLPTFEIHAILGISEQASMFADMEVVAIFMHLSFRVALLVMLIPLFWVKKRKIKFFIPTTVVTAISILWLIIARSVVESEINESGYAGAIKLVLSDGGILFLITAIGALLLSLGYILYTKKEAILKFTLEKIKGYTDQEN